MDDYDAPAYELWVQRGNVVTTQTLESAPWDTHPNDLRKRVAPDGPYDQSWAGIQKVNPVAGVGIHYAQFAWSPLRSQRANYGNILKNNPTPTFFGSGPAVQVPQQQANLDAYQASANRQPGLLQSILRRFTGG